MLIDDVEPIADQAAVYPPPAQVVRGGQTAGGDQIQDSRSVHKQERLVAHQQPVHRSTGWRLERRLDVKAVSGIERVLFQIAVRDTPSTNQFSDAYYALFHPAPGVAGLGKTNVPQAAAIRADLSGTFATDDWNTLALRVQGPHIWFLLNDQPTLYFSDPSLDRGEVILNMLRRSTSGHIVFDDDPNDPTEVAVVARDLRVSALAEGDPSRAPTYQRP